MPKRRTHEEFVEQLAEINPNIIIIGEFKNCKTKIKCKCILDGYEWQSKAGHLLDGHGCPMCSGNLKKTHKQFVNEMKKINPNIEIIGNYINTKTQIVCICKIDKYEWEALPGHLLNSHGCPVCAGNKVLKGINDLWTTNPDMVKLLLNPEEGYLYTKGSHKKVDWVCPNCNNIIRNKTIKNYINRGITCPRCDDGLSYPNKIIFSVIQQIENKYSSNNQELKFYSEKTFNWSQNKRYDMYIEIKNIKIIVEMHGIQHYEQNHRGRTLQEEQENDKFKRELAFRNGIDEYIVVDSRESNIEFIKRNIMNSKLPLLLNFTKDDIDWDKCNKFATNSRIYEVAELYNNGIKNKKLIAEIMKMDRHTISRYYKRCEELGLFNKTIT